MDAGDFHLLLEHLRAQEDRLAAVLANTPTGRGTKFVDLARSYLAGAQAVRLSLVGQHGLAVDPILRGAVERKALRLNGALSDLHIWIMHFIADVGRQDVPVGLIYIIDELLRIMQLGDSDPLIHSDDNYMYSVIGPVAVWKTDFAVCSATFADSIKPVIFNLPGSDPYNVTLSPILAHEVGHPCVKEKDLLASFNAKVDPAKLQPVFAACAATGTPTAAINKAWSSWVEELLCDVIAVAATGPSLLFASLAFLPGPAAGRFGDGHPDPAHRIALTLRCLDSMGWTGLLDADVPDVMSWARHLVTIPADPSVEPVLRELSAAVPLVMDELWAVAKELVDVKIFTPSAFKEDGPHAAAMLNEGIIPVERDGEAMSPWSIVLATWMHLLREGGGAPSAIPAAVDNRPANALSLKAIELAGVLKLWRTGDPAAA